VFLHLRSKKVSRKMYIIEVMRSDTLSLGSFLFVCLLCVWFFFFLFFFVFEKIFYSGVCFSQGRTPPLEKIPGSVPVCKI
jgi:hypothetical protein